MSLRGRGSRKPTVVGNFSSNGSSTPIVTTSAYPEKTLDFKNAIPKSGDANAIASGIQLQTQSPQSVSDHPTMANNIVAPIFIGTPGNPTPEFIYANPYIFDNSDFYPDYVKDCSQSFLFANIVAARRDSGTPIPTPKARGFHTDQLKQLFRMIKTKNIRLYFPNKIYLMIHS